MTEEQLSNLLVDLAACLCAEIEADRDRYPGTEEMCFCGVVPGEQYLDMAGVGDCDGAAGQAWVRLAGAYPSTQPGVAEVSPDNCAMPLGFDIELGILRFFGMEDDGQPWSAAEVLAAALLQTRDVGIIQRAVNCCESLPAKSFVLGQYTPIGPEGFLMGGTWTLSVTPL